MVSMTASAQADEVADESTNEVINFVEFVHISQGETLGVSQLAVNDDLSRLRIDHRWQHGQYTLYDDRTQFMYLVSETKQQIVIIRPITVVAYRQQPRYLLARTRSHSKENLPMVQGVQSETFASFAGKQLCQVVAVAEVFPRFLDLLKSYLNIFAAYQQQLWVSEWVSEDEQDNLNDCRWMLDMAQPTLSLSKGFPVFWHNYNHESAHLTTFGFDDQFDEGFFELPSNYKWIDQTTAIPE